MKAIWELKYSNQALNSSLSYFHSNQFLRTIPHQGRHLGITIIKFNYPASWWTMYGMYRMYGMLSLHFKYHCSLSARPDPNF